MRSYHTDLEFSDTTITKKEPKTKETKCGKTKMTTAVSCGLYLDNHIFYVFTRLL